MSPEWQAAQRIPPNSSEESSESLTAKLVIASAVLPYEGLLRDHVQPQQVLLLGRVDKSMRYSKSGGTSGRPVAFHNRRSIIAALHSRWACRKHVYSIAFRYRLGGRQGLLRCRHLERLSSTSLLAQPARGDLFCHLVDVVRNGFDDAQPRSIPCCSLSSFFLG